MKEFYKKYKPHYRSSLVLAVPVIISQLGHTLVQVADSIIVGQFAGTIPLAAASLVHSVFMVMLVIGMGISFGLTPLIAQANGREDYAACGKLLANSLLINALTGILLFMLVYFGLNRVIDHLGQEPAVVAEAKPYLALLGFSIVPLMFFNTFKQFAEGLGFTKQAMQISIWGNVLNIILGVIFVKGMFGIPRMGLLGVGLSTLIDRVMMAAVMAMYVLRSERFRIYLRHFIVSAVNRSGIRNILKIGAPVAMQSTFEISAFSGAGILMGTIGPNEQAAHQVALSMAAMTYMMAMGVSAAASIKAGNNFGSRNFIALRDSALSSYHIVLAFMAIPALIFMIFHNYLPYTYTSDPSVVAIASQLLIIAGFFQLFDGAQVVGLGILRGIGDVNIPTWITFLAYWLIGIPVGYLLGITFAFGANGIWTGLTLGLLVSAILLFYRFKHLSKKLTAN